MNLGRVICAFLGQNSAAEGHPGARGALNSAEHHPSRPFGGFGRSVCAGLGHTLISEVNNRRSRRRPPRNETGRSTPKKFSVVVAVASPRFSVNSAI